MKAQLIFQKDSQTIIGLKEVADDIVDDNIIDLDRNKFNEFNVLLNDYKEFLFHVQICELEQFI